MYPDEVLVCPVCSDVTLVDFFVEARVSVELCTRCKGLLLDGHEVEPLVGQSLASLLEPTPLTSELPLLSLAATAATLRCPRCEAKSLAPVWHDGSLLLWSCAPCDVHWLPAGTIERLKRLARRFAPPSRRQAAPPSPRPNLIELPSPPATPRPEAPVPHLAAPRDDALLSATPSQMGASFDRRTLLHSRSSFDGGGANLFAVPVALAFGGLFCSTDFGYFLARLSAMPLHELGHATASWLTSRFAVPLPFFTIWSNEQSWFVGILVAAFLLGFTLISYREGRRWGVGLGLGLLLTQLVLSGFLSARASLFVQIASGALGEIFFGALLLATFHFPLPDRLRWDFWRWFALVPGALSLTQSLRLWFEARHDLNLLPWGSALGSASDGDMNRLVQQFSWRPQDLAALYAALACLGALGVALAWGLLALRSRRPPTFQSGSAAGGPT